MPASQEWDADDLAYLQSFRATPHAQETPASPASVVPQQVQDVQGFTGATAHLGDQFAQGALASLKRTYLGLKQLGTYLGGDESARQAINEQISALEQEYGDALASPAGKIGNVVGTVAQFAIPGAAAGVAGKAFPAAANAARAILGQPGSVGRAAATMGAFEAAQPVQPGNTSMEDFALQKGARAAAGAALGAGTGAIINRMTRPGPAIDPAMPNLVKQAEAVGLKGKAALTPAQRTQDRYLLQKEEGFLSSPGSSNLIAGRRRAQQDVIDEAAAKVLGQPGAKPTEAAFGTARETANKAYEPIARIPSISADPPYMEALHQLAKTTKSRDVARVVKQIRENGELPGSAFLEHLQDVRTLSSDAAKGGQQYTAQEFGKLGSIMEGWLERALSGMAGKQGSGVTADTLKQFKQARTDLSAVRALERATDPVLGKVNPNKVLNEQFRRQRPGSAPSPTTQKLQGVSDVARVMRQTMPYIGSSGTAERAMGQKIVEAEGSPLAALRMAVPSMRNYLAAKYYLSHGADPGVLNVLHPGVNAMLRRWGPPTTLGTAEALAE